MAATSTAATPLPHAVVSTDDTATSTTKVHDMLLDTDSHTNDIATSSHATTHLDTDDTTTTATTDASSASSSSSAPVSSHVAVIKSPTRATSSTTTTTPTSSTSHHDEPSSTPNPSTSTATDTLAPLVDQSNGSGIHEPSSDVTLVSITIATPQLIELEHNDVDVGSQDAMIVDRPTSSASTGRSYAKANESEAVQSTEQATATTTTTTTTPPSSQRIASLELKVARLENLLTENTKRFEKFEQTVSKYVSELTTELQHLQRFVRATNWHETRRVVVDGSSTVVRPQEIDTDVATSRLLLSLGGPTDGSKARVSIVPTIATVATPNATAIPGLRGVPLPQLSPSPTTGGTMIGLAPLVMASPNAPSPMTASSTTTMATGSPVPLSPLTPPPAPSPSKLAATNKTALAAANTPSTPTLPIYAKLEEEVKDLELRRQIARAVEQQRLSSAATAAAATVAAAAAASGKPYTEQDFAEMVNSARQEIYQEPVTMKRKREDDDLTGEASNGNNSSGSNNSGNSSKRRRGKLPQEARLELMSWLFKHSSRPYPTEEEKSNLVAATGLTQVQINNWFSNARRRILRRSKFELGGKRDIMMTDDDSDDDEGGSGDDLDTQGPSTPTSTSTMMSNATSSLASPGGGMYAGGSVPPPPTTSASPAGAIRTMPGLSPTNAARPMASSISRPMPATRPPIVGALPQTPGTLVRQAGISPASQPGPGPATAGAGGVGGTVVIKQERDASLMFGAMASRVAQHARSGSDMGRQRSNPPIIFVPSNPKPASSPAASTAGSSAHSHYAAQQAISTPGDSFLATAPHSTVSTSGNHR